VPETGTAAALLHPHALPLPAHSTAPRTEELLLRHSLIDEYSSLNLSFCVRTIVVLNYSISLQRVVYRCQQRRTAQDIPQRGVCVCVCVCVVFRRRAIYFVSIAKAINVCIDRR